MRTVEDRDLAMPRGIRMDAPKEVMGKFGGGGLLEAGDARAVRIEGAEDVIDRAILPAGVEGLQDDQDRVLVLGVKDSLLTRELLAVILRLLLRFGFRCVFAFVGRIELVQLDLGVRVDPKLFAVSPITTAPQAAAERQSSRSCAPRTAACGRRPRAAGRAWSADARGSVGSLPSLLDRSSTRCRTGRGQSSAQSPSAPLFRKTPGSCACPSEPAPERCEHCRRRSS